jgi:hypothetical protein
VLSASITIVILENTMSTLTVLVCGGRDYSDRLRLFKLLDYNRAKIGLLVHGAAKGADSLAGAWALSRGVRQLAFAAEWKKYGRKAGAIRNVQMLRDAVPDLVVAFPGGVGTQHMIGIARKAGVRVIEVPGETIVQSRQRELLDACASHTDQAVL